MWSPTWLGFPFMMVVTLGALQSIPRDLEQAASVDGATGWQRFWHITLPLLKPALLPAVVLGSVWTFNMFNIIYLVSGGEPDSPPTSSSRMPTAGPSPEATATVTPLPMRCSSLSYWCFTAKSATRLPEGRRSNESRPFTAASKSVPHAAHPQLPCGALSHSLGRQDGPHPLTSLFARPMAHPHSNLFENFVLASSAPRPRTAAGSLAANAQSPQLLPPLPPPLASPFPAPPATPCLALPFRAVMPA